MNNPTNIIKQNSSRGIDTCNFLSLIKAQPRHIITPTSHNIVRFGMNGKGNVNFIIDRITAIFSNRFISLSISL